MTHVHVFRGDGIGKSGNFCADFRLLYIQHSSRVTKELNRVFGHLNLLNACEEITQGA